jgi:electron transfer flavoprotein beta subunit
MRRILVGLKRVIDYSVRVHLLADGSGVVTDGVRMSVNPFCEIALEEALRIREQGRADEIVAVSIGPGEVAQQLRTGLAMGADRAIHVNAQGELEPLTIARCLLALVAADARDGLAHRIEADAAAGQRVSRFAGGHAGLEDRA